jgi:dsRNA-specific ribonuclease
MEEFTPVYTKYNVDDDIVSCGEQLIFNPYNPLNVEVSENDIKEILKKYGLPPIIHNFNLYKRAFVHISYLRKPDYENSSQNITIAPKPDNCLPLKTKSFERLEYLGDGVLEFSAKKYLYTRFPKEEPEFMTEKKILLVNNESIGKIAQEMGLHKWLILSKNAEEKNIRTSHKKLGCLFEAFVAAIKNDMDKETVTYNDEIIPLGYHYAEKFVRNIFETHVDWAVLLSTNNNYKNIVQKKIQKEYKVTPIYHIIEYTKETGFKTGVYLSLGFGPDEPINFNKAITLNVNLDSDKKTINSEINKYLENNGGKILILLGAGTHPKKKKAEQIACKEANNILE